MVTGLYTSYSERAVCHFRIIAARRRGRRFRTAAILKRISLATSLYRAAMTGFLNAAREVKDLGQFSSLERCVTTAELNKLMGS